MKKMFSLALALIMALALCVPALAYTDSETKTIKIENSIKDETYTAIKIFDATYSDADGDNDYDNFAYTIDGDWKYFSPIVGYINDTAATAERHSGNGLTLTKTTEKSASGADYKWNVVYDQATFNVVRFAEYLNTFIKNNPSLTEDPANNEYVAGFVKAEGKGATITVEGAGYYFVDSSLGALCALDTADTVTVYEKNSIPTITKWVDEDDDTDANAVLGNSEWQKTADADVGQSVNYLLIVDTGSNHKNGEQTSAGADEDYVIVDTIPAGLSFSGIEKIYDDMNGEGKPWVEGTDYTVETSQDINNDTTVKITLKESKVSTLAENVHINIPYSVKVAAQAVIGSEGNTNRVVLTYKEQESRDEATLYTWEVPVFKHNNANAPLAGAKFEVKKDDAVMTFDVVDGEPNVYVYNPKGGAVEIITTTDSGKFTIRGLDSDTYTLTETEAPAGYNALTAPITFKIDAAEKADGNYTGAYEISVYDAEKDEFEVTTTVNVLNNTGTELPSTGGMGTTIFYVIGGVLMAGAAVLLVTKKKLANQE